MYVLEGQAGAVRATAESGKLYTDRKTALYFISRRRWNLHEISELSSPLPLPWLLNSTFKDSHNALKLLAKLRAELSAGSTDLSYTHV